MLSFLQFQIIFIKPFSIVYKCAIFVKKSTLPVAHFPHYEKPIAWGIKDFNCIIRSKFRVL